LIIQITALEQSPDRYKTLVSQLKRAGSLRHDTAGAVKAIQCDFTKQKGEDFSDVTHMLLDPSCSGSGILSRLDYLTNEQDQNDEVKEGKEQERLRGLSAFQSNMIDHAMQFPSLRRFIYSTCSIHHEENESVVMRALQSEVAKSRGWKLAPKREVLPSWSTRGIIEHCDGQMELAESMIRCVPGGEEKGDKASEGQSVVDLDATNGFFLACFVRNSNNNAKNKKRNRRAKEKAKENKRAKLSKGEDSEDDGEDGEDDE